MPRNTQNKDLRTLAYVLRRTNYGEADRILNLITPHGKISAIARGVRKEKSKLAGGVELFSKVELNLHIGRGDFAIVTGSKMQKYYGEILRDYNKMEFAGIILKKISNAAEQSDSSDFFEIVDQCFNELNKSNQLELIKGWFVLNFLKAIGEEANLYRDTSGAKLKAEGKYVWDVGQSAFTPVPHGDYGASEIKMLRLMSSAKLGVLCRVKISDGSMRKVMEYIRLMGVLDI